jgi:enamine deaminase RidA (YjgF/YER057c/UK114 family)
MLALAAALLVAQTTPAPAAQPPSTAPVAAYETPRRLPTPGGEVTITHPGEQRGYDEDHYAPARRVGDTLYISGVIAGVPQQGQSGAEAFKTSLRQAFRRIERQLKVHGASFADVAMINSFHVWTHPLCCGTRDEHFAAVSAVKDEFMPAPYPAWTAVGAAGLLADTGLVEIQVIAHVPAQTPTRQVR